MLDIEGILAYVGIINLGCCGFAQVYFLKRWLENQNINSFYSQIVLGINLILLFVGFTNAFVLIKNKYSLEEPGIVLFLLAFVVIAFNIKIIKNIGQINKQ